MEQEARESSDGVDDALRYNVKAMFSPLHTLMEIGQLDILKDEKLSNWLEVTQYQLKTERLPLVFCKAPLRKIEDFDETHLQAPTTRIVQADEDRNVVTFEGMSSRGLTRLCDSFCQVAVKFFESLA